MKEKGLTAKQQTSLEYYLNPTSETFNNLLQSMIRAGYTEKYANHRGWEMLDKGYIQAYMKDYKAKLYNKQAINVEYMQSEHQRLAEKAESKGDLAVATRNKELLGKTIAAYTDNIADKRDKSPEPLSEQELAELKRLAIHATNTVKTA